MMGRLAVCSAVGGLVGGTISLGLPEYTKHREPLHVQVKPPTLYMGGVNILPLYTSCLAMLPPFLREPLLLSLVSPRRALVPRDLHHLYGKDPYTIQPVVKDKVWRVGFVRENHFLATWDTRQQVKLLGMDFTTEENSWRVMQGAEAYGRAASDQAHKDLEMVRRVARGEEERKEMTRENMVVVRLESGGLLLYSPVMVHQESELGSWLSKERVEWIVVGSSEHTLQLPQVLARYPDARIVAPANAVRKLQWVSALPRGKVDFETTNPGELAQANTLLGREGVQLAYVKGDCLTHSTFLLAHGVLCEADLLYTHVDGEGFLSVSKDQFRELRPEDAMSRLFKFGLLSKPNSPNGFLPSYRFWMMDPSLLWPLLLTPPHPDGQDTKLMANSLRTVLALPFHTAVGVHFDDMDADFFRRGLDANWNWLDGQSLLPPSSSTAETEGG